MNISGLGSTSWYTSLLSSSKKTSDSGGASSSSDSATISSASFAALLQEQGGGPPEITDDQAAQIGSTLQEKNASLFSALDSDGNGTLSATELKTGMEAMHGSQGPPPGPPPSGPPPAMSEEDASAISSDIESSNSNLFSALDTNGDGTLSADELKAGRDSMFDAMDANGLKPPAPPEQSDRSGQQPQSGQNNSLTDYQTNLLNELLQSFAQNTSK